MGARGGFRRHERAVARCVAAGARGAPTQSPMNALFEGDHAAAPTSFQALMIALILAYVFGQLIAWVYVFTHSGVSYSRSFVVSLIVLPVLVALVLVVMSNNLVTAFGLIAIFAVVRFRNVLRDT